MLIPVRCFTCGSVISNKWLKYTELCEEYRKETKQTDIELLDIDELRSKEKKESAEFKALRDLKVQRMCCRRHFLCNVDLIDDI
tara:strand:- start:9688 stop:9939 length:252 start_codon:yes stop_codon:yes gene_type:complete